MPDAQKILATVRKAATLFRDTPGRVGGVVRLDEADEVMVVGDLHGNLTTFKQAMDVAGLDRNPRRHLVLQELAHDKHADPDEGDLDRSHRLIDVVCALKCQVPDRVHLLPGNHELSELTGRSISKKGVPLNKMFREGVEASYGGAAGAMIAAYHELFRALPLACRTPNRVFIVHTLPEAKDLDTFDPEILRSGEWTEESLRRGGTVYALTWGRDNDPDTADRFAAVVDADLFITGHQPQEGGFLRANHRQLILDGTDPNPSYCLFPTKTPVTIDGLVEGARRFPVPE